MSTVPQEIIDHIDAFLDDASKIALRISCASLHVKLSKWPIKATRPISNTCYYKRVSSHIDLDLTRRRCILCKQRYPKDLFSHDMGWTPEDCEYLRRHGVDRCGGPGMIPTATDMCDYERRRFILFLDINQSLRYQQNLCTTRQATSPMTSRVRWSSTFIKMCMHCCRHHEPWRQYCVCSCDFCGVRRVRIFIRLLFHESTHSVPERYVIIKYDGQDKWYVKEWHRNSHPVYLEVAELDRNAKI